VISPLSFLISSPSFFVLLPYMFGLTPSSPPSSARSSLCVLQSPGSLTLSPAPSSQLFLTISAEICFFFRGGFCPVTSSQHRFSPQMGRNPSFPNTPLDFHTSSFDRRSFPFLILIPELRRCLLLRPQPVLDFLRWAICLNLSLWVGFFLCLCCLDGRASFGNPPIPCSVLWSSPFFILDFMVPLKFPLGSLFTHGLRSAAGAVYSPFSFCFRGAVRCSELLRLFSLPPNFSELPVSGIAFFGFLGGLWSGFVFILGFLPTIHIFNSFSIPSSSRVWQCTSLSLVLRRLLLAIMFIASLGGVSHQVFGLCSPIE